MDARSKRMLVWQESKLIKHLFLISNDCSISVFHVGGRFLFCFLFFWVQSFWVQWNNSSCLFHPLFLLAVLCPGLNLLGSTAGRRRVCGITWFEKMRRWTSLGHLLQWRSTSGRATRHWMKRGGDKCQLRQCCSDSDHGVKYSPVSKDFGLWPLEKCKSQPGLNVNCMTVRMNAVYLSSTGSNFNTIIDANASFSFLLSNNSDGTEMSDILKGSETISGYPKLTALPKWSDVLCYKQ